MRRMSRALMVIVALMMLASPLVSAEAEGTPPTSEEPPPAASSAEPDDGDITGEGLTDTGNPPDGSAGDGDPEADPGEGRDVGDPAPDTDGDADEEDDQDADDPADAPGTIGEATAENSPEAQAQSRGVMLLAAQTLTVTVVTSDEGGAVPTGTIVRVNESVERDQNWDSTTNTPVVFTMNGSRSGYSVSVPWESDYIGATGQVRLTSDGNNELTVTLLKKATVTVKLGPEGTDLAGTNVCLWGSVQGCQEWEAGTESLVFKVSPGEVEYAVTPPAESGLSPLIGTFTAESGAGIEQVFTLPTPATLNVTVVPVEGIPVPADLNVVVTPSVEGYLEWTGDDLTFRVTPGEVTYRVNLSGTGIRDVRGTITVAPGESADLEIRLQPKDPATLRVYVLTADNEPVPDGTEICVDLAAPDLGDAVNNECQTLTGDFVTFALGQGWADVTVTPPAGSGYEAETETFWTILDQTRRVVFTLERTTPALPGDVEMTISREGGGALNMGEVGVGCLHTGAFGTVPGFDCIREENRSIDAGGRAILQWDELTPGTYNYTVPLLTSEYGVGHGTLTVTAGETTKVSVVIPEDVEHDEANLIIDVMFIDGSPLPEGTIVCAFPYHEGESGEDEEAMLEKYCEQWTGVPVSFALPATLAGYGALLPGGNPEEPGMHVVHLSPGETREVTVTFLPETFDAGITHTVSDDAPQSGETVTYTIRTWGNDQNQGAATLAAQLLWFDFEVTNILPAELTDITVACSGTYTPAFPGPCAEVVDGVLAVAGEFHDPGRFAEAPRYFNTIITVTGTITGDPGTIVSNTACLDHDWRSEEPTGIICATATLTIAEPVDDPGDPTGPEDPEDPTDPTDPEDPADPEDPTDPEDPEDPTEPEDPEDPEDPVVPGTPTPTEPGTPAPSDPGTPTSADPEPTAAPKAGAVVTSLPKTGHGGGAGSTLAILAGLAAAVLLGGTGLIVRSRQPER